MNITRRDIAVTIISVGATLGFFVMAQGGKPAVMGASAFDWKTIEAKRTYHAAKTHRRDVQHAMR